MENKYGEPYRYDSQFVADCRKLQSIYRVGKNQKIRPYKGKYYGNYISNGENTGVNFIRYYIFEYAKKRVKEKKPYETINSDRLYNNLLSSQPMAFNLFYPLKKMLEEDELKATKVIQLALPKIPIYKVTNINIEFIPEDYEELTGDLTAMDAIIEFDDKEGNSCFVAIETKYSENLGINEASIKNNKKHPKEILKELQLFVSDIEEKIEKKKIKLTQIYRNFILSERYGNKYKKKSYSIILAPKNHPSTKREKESLLQYLKKEYKYKLDVVDLEYFVSKLIMNSEGDYHSIFEEFYDRYLDFSKLNSLK